MTEWGCESFCEVWWQREKASDWNTFSWKVPSVYTTSLVYNKEFELQHTSKTSTISALGFKFSNFYPFILLSSIFSKKLEHKFVSLNCLPCRLSHLTVTLVLKKVVLLFFHYWASLMCRISSMAIDESDDESDEEVPQAIPLFTNAHDISLFYITILFKS